MKRYQYDLLPEFFERHGLPRPDKEVLFHPSRKWRFDFAWPGHRIALEIEGGIFMKGRKGHASVSGIKRDMEKYNAAAVLGWKVIRVLPEDAAKIETINMLKELLPWNIC